MIGNLCELFVSNQYFNKRQERFFFSSLEKAAPSLKNLDSSVLKEFGKWVDMKDVWKVTLAWTTCAGEM